MFYITFFIFCYTLFDIYQLNLTVTNYQITYPSYQKSYSTVTIVIIPTLLSDYHFQSKIKTYINFTKLKITTYDNITKPKIKTYDKFSNRKITTYKNKKRPAGASQLVLSGPSVLCHNKAPIRSVKYPFIPASVIRASRPRGARMALACLFQFAACRRRLTCRAETSRTRLLILPTRPL
jgi:hypothetical protein